MCSTYYSFAESVVFYYPLFFLYSSGPLRVLHSFPTRRSSDLHGHRARLVRTGPLVGRGFALAATPGARRTAGLGPDRKSTRLNSSHVAISYAVFCLKKKKKIRRFLSICLIMSNYRAGNGRRGS